jgi:predicted  nucleic acid-binding Zn-ribbon protein
VSTANEIAALREATREAHEVLRDLRTERRAVEQLLAGIEGRVKRAVGDLIEEAVTREVATLGEATDMAMRKSVAKVEREFDRLERILTGREKGAKHGPIEDLIRRHVASREAPE